MAYVKTNQTSRQLPEQIKIFEIINAETVSGSAKGKFWGPRTLRTRGILQTWRPY